MPIHDPHLNRDHRSTVDHAIVRVPGKRTRHGLHKRLAAVGIACLLGAFAMAQVIEPSPSSSPSPAPSQTPEATAQAVSPVSSVSTPVSSASAGLASASSAPSPSSSVVASLSPSVITEVASSSNTDTSVSQEKSDTPLPPRADSYRAQTPGFGVFLSASAPVGATPASTETGSVGTSTIGASPMKSDPIASVGSRPSRVLDARAMVALPVRAAAVAPAITAAHPRLILDSATLGDMRAHAAANTAEWQLLKSTCDSFIG
ncbi:MAG TPA: hypothetical protein VLZ32_03215, partial [Rhodanobacter sp.]|nr:hypothetical protein [Rhodanobacter sp.]